MGARRRIPGTVRRRLGPGDVDALVRLHGTLYAREYGYDRTFEAYVADGLADFVRTFRPDRDRIWLAEAGGRIIGSIAILHRPGGSAQLRWFLVHPDRRGRGLGTALMRRAIRFSRERGYRAVFLWTTSELTAAARLYARVGFRKTRAETHRMWGKVVTEERYALRLRGGGR